MAGNLQDCICQLAEVGPDYKSTVNSLIDGLVGILTSIKTLLEMFGFNLEDEAKKLALQTAVDIFDATISPVEAPFSSVLGYTRMFSDCDPINTLANTLKNVRDSILNPAWEMRFELEQLIASIDDDKKEIELLQRWIDMLNAVRDALNQCGQ